MKKILITLCISLGLYSCSSFLEEKPYDFLAPENLQTSPTGIKQMVTGMYSVFFNPTFGNQSWIYLTATDDDLTNGVDWMMGVYGVGNFKGGWIYNNPGADPYYFFYRLIRATNEVLEAVPNVDFSNQTPGIKEQYIGEALTIRAWAYFHLVQMFGPVPLHLHTDDPSNMVRTPVTDVYTQIISDLHAAEGKLFLNSKLPSSLGRGHITKGAAQLLLAKVYNTMGSGSLTNAQVTVPITITRLRNGTILRKDTTITKNKVDGYDFSPLVAYDSAKVVAGRLIASKEYQMTSYANTWNPVNFGSTEFVFALETVASEFSTSYNQTFSPVGLNGSGWLHYSKDLYYLHDSLDERRLYGIAHRFQAGSKRNNGNWRMYYFPSEDSLYYRNTYGTDETYTDTTSNRCFLMKWYLGEASNPSVQLGSSDPTVIGSPQQNYPLLRYTEAFLIVAEAENEINGPTQLAYDALDMIRSWRYNTTNYQISRTMNQQQLRSYILNERTREFIGEGYRRFDLIRWGIYLDVMNKVKSRQPNFDNQNQIISKEREPKHLLYPVPTIEIDGNSLFGPNNYGW
ncbi:MAG TPA: RagB/SusD family nutrient uptake outer membrane protein [Bacteroidales bacterium]